MQPSNLLESASLLSLSSANNYFLSTSDTGTGTSAVLLIASTKCQYLPSPWMDHRLLEALVDTGSFAGVVYCSGLILYRIIDHISRPYYPVVRPEALCSQPPSGGLRLAYLLSFRAWSSLLGWRFPQHDLSQEPVEIRIVRAIVCSPVLLLGCFVLLSSTGHRLAFAPTTLPGLGSGPPFLRYQTPVRAHYMGETSASVFA